MLTNYKAGQFGELIAKFFLRLKFYKIISSRYKIKGAEIDIIAKKGNIVIFVEVKYRKKIDLSFHPITTQQLTRIRRAAEIFLAHNKLYHNCEIRFDYIEIELFKIRHIINAF